MVSPHQQETIRIFTTTGLGDKSLLGGGLVKFHVFLIFTPKSWGEDEIPI